MQDSAEWCSAGSPFLPPDKYRKFLRFFVINIIIREYGSTLYVGLAHVFPPTNTKFKPLLLPTQTGMPYTNTHKHRTSYFKSILTFMGPSKHWKCLSAARQKRQILAIFFFFIIIIIIINFKIFSCISSHEIPPRSACKCLQNLYQSVAIRLK